MRRHVALTNLSRDHHHALVLAKHALQAGRETIDCQAAFAMELVDTFRREIEKHFQKEESSLLPLLEKAGLATPVARAISEHNALRELVGRLNGGEFSCLSAFADLLVEHVRFEERDLFLLAESKLTPELLARIDQELCN